MDILPPWFWPEITGLVATYPYFFLGSVVVVLCGIGRGLSGALWNLLLVVAIFTVYIAGRHFLAEIDAIFAPIREILAG